MSDASNGDGMQQGHFESGELQWECAFENGEKHGTLRFWYEDGMLQSQREYLHGMQHGPFREFHPDGRVASEGTYQGDELVEARQWDTEGNEMPNALARLRQSSLQE